MKLSNEEKQICRQYVKDNPECTVGDVVTKVFGKSIDVMARVPQTLVVMSYLLSLNESG